MAGSKKIIWGLHPVISILETMPEVIEIIQIQSPGTSGKAKKVLSLAEIKGVKTSIVQKIKIAGEENANHQGVLARIAGYPSLSLKDLLSDPGFPFPLLIALDSIQDPHNLGAIIRSAVGSGVSGLIMTKDRSAPLEGSAAKVAAGALSKLKYFRVTNLSVALQKLKDSGYWIYGADGQGENNVYNTNFNGPVCLVIGAEGKGLRPLVKKQCDFLIRIPLKPEVESLNASVAAGIMLFEIARQKNILGT